MALKVLHLSTYDANGGAARAAYSLHRALLENGVTSRMRVGIKQTDDLTVVQANRRKFALSSLMDRQLWRFQRSPRTTWRSPARFSSISAKEVNESGADVVNLHWVTDGLMSIEEIGKIEIPIVWSMYDMWPFSGTEHYGNVDSRRWRDGYTKTNRPMDESGFDLDRWTFDRKVANWTTMNRSFHLVPASAWLENVTRQSLLMSHLPITRIPHVVDTSVFAPMDRSLARTQANLPQNPPIILFLASAGIDDHRKGWDLLAPALRQVSRVINDLCVVVVGPVPGNSDQMRARDDATAVIHWHGTVTSDEELRNLYASADVVAVPSREDNLPLTAMESLSCGTPIVGFAVGGLSDIIERPGDGYLAPLASISALADCLIKSLTSDRGAMVHPDARIWSPHAVARDYVELYEHVVTPRS